MIGIREYQSLDRSPTLRSYGLALQLGKPDQVRYPRIDAALNQERRQLPSVVRLVIEEMGNSHSERITPRLGIRHAHI